MKKFLQKILFSLPEEMSHELSLDALAFAHNLKFLHKFATQVDDKFNLYNLEFKNRVGLAAGLDKNGDYIDALADLGFGFIEVGAVTPKPQFGNPKPRLFRYAQENSVINRMGFNNKGVDYMVNSLKNRTTKIPVGVNIGKNKDTPLEQAVDDYKICLEKLYPYADYISLNISSPNTPDLRKLQTPEYLSDLITQIQDLQQKLTKQQGFKLPIFIKIAPDFDDESQLLELIQVLNKQKVDGVIATNTSVDKSLLQNVPSEHQQGGVSGKVLKNLADKILEKVAQNLNKDIPIIGVGGISCAKDGADKIKLGASLVQIYTGFVYKGIDLISEVGEAILANNPTNTKNASNTNNTNTKTNTNN